MTSPYPICPKCSQYCLFKIISDKPVKIRLNCQCGYQEIKNFSIFLSQPKNKIENNETCEIHEDSPFISYCLVCHSHLCASCIQDHDYTHKQYSLNALLNMPAITLKKAQAMNHVENYLGNIKNIFIKELNAKINLINQACEESVFLNNQMLSFIDSLINNYSPAYPNYYIETNIINNTNFNIYLFNNNKEIEKIDKVSIQKMINFYEYYSIIKGNIDFNLYQVKEPKIVDVPKSITSMVLLQDGRFAASANCPKIFIYNLENYNIDLKLEGHKDTVTYSSQLEDGRLISCSSDQSIKVWTITKTEYQCVGTIEKAHTSNIYKVIPLTYNRMASCSWEDKIKIWNTESIGELITAFQENVYNVHSLIQVKETENLISGSTSDKLCIWNLGAYQCEKVIEKIHCSEKNSLVEIDSSRIAVGGENHLYIINIFDYKIEYQITDYRLGNILCLTQYDEIGIFIGSSNGLFSVYDVSTNTLASCKDIPGNNSITAIMKIDQNIVLTGANNIKVYNKDE